ncbi:SETMAR [Cordylochernes scorpioides]|uniref:SETMAR n=1 Tax=Cordylochernes scorpioides TaxID=51811 RepID=A0ABY6LVM6_9ARAC|nr:SETMAR [Cordylochernes scorpioides]
MAPDSCKGPTPAASESQEATEAVWDICNVYGKGVIRERAAQKWFAKFKNGDLDLEDTPRSGTSKGPVEGKWSPNNS